MSRLAVMILCAVAVPTCVRANDAPTISTFRRSDAQGTEHALKDWSGKKAIVFFFLATECPAVNGYAPTMERIAKNYGARDVIVYGVHCDPNVTADIAREHAKEYRLTFPILLDPQQTLAAQTKTTRTATAVVVDANGQVLYRGRIDDRYPALGKRRDEPRTHELEDALDALIRGAKPVVRETEVVGCPLPKIRSDRDAAK